MTTLLVHDQLPLCCVLPQKEREHHPLLPELYSTNRRPTFRLDPLHPILLLHLLPILPLPFPFVLLNHILPKLDQLLREVAHSRRRVGSQLPDCYSCFG